MSTGILRFRILGVLGSTGVAAGLSLSACGGESVRSEADAGEGGTGGTSAGTRGEGKTKGSGGDGAMPGTGGGSSGSGGKTIGSGGSGGSGGGGGSLSVAGTAGVSAPIAGSAGTGVSSTGGASSVAGEGGSGGSLPDNCWGSSVGVCCSEPEECVSPQEAWSRVQGGGKGGAGGAGGQANAGAPGEMAMGGEGGDGVGGAADVPGIQECPPPTAFSHGFCDGYQAGTQSPGQCCYSRWSGTCCGRPFVVEGEMRFARAMRRGDWSAAPASASLELDARTRAEVASEWLADALLEHASVASFARFVLDLLAVGAPAALVERAQAALGDEIVHARLCFSLASQYAGQDLGPTALATSESARTVRLEELAAAAVHEGCVGETLAAMQAEAQLALVEESRAREALEVIARDEATHAELAWAFVRWAVERGGESVRRAVRAAFIAAERKLETVDLSDEPDVDRGTFAAHGRLLPSERAACHRAAFRDVIRPCRHALLNEN